MKLYPPQAVSVLGYDLVLNYLHHQLRSALGEDSLKNLTMADTLDEVRIRLGRVTEIKNIFEAGHTPPMDDFLDIRGTLDRILPDGAFVAGAELREVFRVCRAMRRVRKWFAGSDYPLCRQVTARITTLRPLEDHIHGVIHPSGDVRTEASPELFAIRQMLQRLKASLRSNIYEVLRTAHSQGHAAGAQPTMRGGRMVVPIRAEAKRKIKGFIHGASATGQTIYIEPAACLSLNNEVQILLAEERREIERILRDAAAKIRANDEVLRTNLSCLGYLDMLQAIAQMSTQLEAVTPELNTDGQVKIHEGRNPALMLHLGDKKDVVPLDITLDDAVRTIVISGPNAGGKTVAMKTVGLMSVMIAYGMPVPIHPSSKMCHFNQVMVEIGDQQNIEQDLSTFSARVQGLTMIVDDVDRNTLVLIDEIGSGTDPSEGAALARSVLEHATTLGARTIVTTHHGALKAFAHGAEGVVNGSMEFDHVSLKPTFRFRQGLPGSSYAFLISERLGFSSRVLARARSLLGETQVALESLLIAVQAQRKELAEQLRQLQGRLVRTRVLRFPHTSGSSRKLRRRRVPRKARVKHVPAVKQSKAPSRIDVGARVVLDGGTTEGEVVSLEGTRVTVTFGSMRVKVDAKRLRPVRRKRKRRSMVKSTPANPRMALDLRGLRSGEAIREVQQLIDNAVRADLGKVQILHGKGTGALRTAVHSYLTKSDAVKEFSMPKDNPGLTFVKLG